MPPQAARTPAFVCLTVCCKVRDGAKAPSAPSLPAPDKLRACSKARSAEGVVGTEGGNSQELGDLGGSKNFHWKRALKGRLTPHLTPEMKDNMVKASL